MLALASRTVRRHKGVNMNTLQKFFASVVILFGVLLMQSLAMAAPGQGVPFEQQQGQIDVLNTQVQALIGQVGGGDQNMIVSCTPPDTIGAALANAKPGGRLTITVQGTCTENVSIARDDVTLMGGSGTVNGQITVNGARRVSIVGLTVTGPGFGIVATENADVTVQDSTIDLNDAGGLDVNSGALVVLIHNTIRGGNTYGLFVRDGGIARIERNNTLESTASGFNGATIAAYRNATVRIVEDGNVVRNTAATAPDPFGNCGFGNTHFAVDVEHNSSFRQDQGHASVIGDVYAFHLTGADFRDVDITGSVFSDAIFSSIRLRDQGRVAGNVTVTGLICFFGGNSSVQIRGALREDTVTVNGKINCNFSFLPPSNIPVFVGPTPPACTAGTPGCNGLLNCF